MFRLFLIRRHERGGAFKRAQSKDKTEDRRWKAGFVGAVCTKYQYKDAVSLQQMSREVVAIQ